MNIIPLHRQCYADLLADYGARKLPVLCYEAFKALSDEERRAFYRHRIYRLLAGTLERLRKAGMPATDRKIQEVVESTFEFIRQQSAGGKWLGKSERYLFIESIVEAMTGRPATPKQVTMIKELHGFLK